MGTPPTHCGIETLAVCNNYHHHGATPDLLPGDSSGPCLIEKATWAPISAGSHLSSPMGETRGLRHWGHRARLDGTGRLSGPKPMARCWARPSARKVHCSGCQGHGVLSLSGKLPANCRKWQGQALSPWGTLRSSPGQTCPGWVWVLLARADPGCALRAVQDSHGACGSPALPNQRSHPNTQISASSRRAPQAQPLPLWGAQALRPPLLST